MRLIIDNDTRAVYFYINSYFMANNATMQSLKDPASRIPAAHGIFDCAAKVARCERKRREQRRVTGTRTDGVGSREMVANLFSGAYTFNPFVWS